MPQSKNIARLSEDMKRELIAIIGQMKDPRLKTGLLTVMRIELAPDLSFAKVFVSVLGTQPDAPQQAVAALNRAAGHVRSEVAKRLQIRKTPDLCFVAVGGAAYAVKFF